MTSTRVNSGKLTMVKDASQLCGTSYMEELATNMKGEGSGSGEEKSTLNHIQKQCTHIDGQYSVQDDSVDKEFEQWISALWKDDVELTPRERELLQFQEISVELGRKLERRRYRSNLRDPQSSGLGHEVEEIETQMNVGNASTTRTCICLKAEDKYHVHKELQRMNEAEKAKRLKLEEDLKLARHELELEKKKLLCQICMVNSRNCLIAPCMHLLYCINCLLIQNSRQRRNSCPTCGAAIISLLQCNLGTE